MKRRKLDSGKWIFGLLCGALIGAGAILPGISAAALCVAFGLYQPLMEVLTSPRRALPLYWQLFLPVALGWPVGFFILAKVLVLLFGSSPAVGIWMFIGLIIGTAPALYREAGRQGRGRGAKPAALAGFAVMFGVLFYIQHMAEIQVAPSFGAYVFSGFLFGLSTVIPGMTCASILMALGLYQPLAQSAANLDASVLLGLIPGMVLTILLLAKLANYLFQRFYVLAYHAVLGIVVASTLSIVPLHYTGWGEVALSALCCGAGFGVACWMGHLEGKIKKE